MSREQMVDFVCWFLRAHQPAREFGGLRFDAEEIVDEYLRGKAA
jgi:hypothetical protein